MSNASEPVVVQSTHDQSSQPLLTRIKASNIFLVGAGGIGCEVLKGLLLHGFPRITVIDLDTIDVSNLNRQFLYNKSHVGQPKAVVAARVAQERFAHRDADGRPLSTVTPLYDSVTNLEYEQDFYSQFTLVINALDNNKTRIHVNRLCLAARVPLVESGSAGYLGYAKLIFHGVTKCFECDEPKKDENTYASCTIRTTPSQPIHCIVWAKYLFAQLFGEDDHENEVSNPVSAENLPSLSGDQAGQADVSNGGGGSGEFLIQF